MPKFNMLYLKKRREYDAMTEFNIIINIEVIMGQVEHWPKKVARFRPKF